jgi:hypothetical protein
MTGAATRLPRVAVLGVGSVGGVLAASLISARKAEVHLISRGVGLKALKDTGLSVKTQENSEPISFTQQAGDFNVMSNGEAERASAGLKMDYILVATKAHQLTGSIDALTGLTHPGTAIVPCVNGMPWWLGRHILEAAGSSSVRLAACDPSGRLSSEINASQILGSMSFISGSVARDYSLWTSGWESSKNLLQLGDPGLGSDNDLGEKAEALSGLFASLPSKDDEASRSSSSSSRWPVRWSRTSGHGSGTSCS